MELTEILKLQRFQTIDWPSDSGGYVGGERETEQDESWRRRKRTNGCGNGEKKTRRGALPRVVNKEPLHCCGCALIATGKTANLAQASARPINSSVPRAAGPFLQAIPLSVLVRYQSIKRAQVIFNNPMAFSITKTAGALEETHP